MRIAIDATVLWGQDRYSGVEKVVDRVTYRLLSRPGNHLFRVFVPSDWAGFEEALLSPSLSPTIAAEPADSAPDASVIRLPFAGSQRLRRILWQQFTLPGLLARWSADRVFCPAYVMPIRAPCPATIFLHDLHGLSWRRTRPENYLHHRLILPASLRRAASVVCPSRAVLAEAARYLRPGCAGLVAPLGVDAAFQPASAPISSSRRYLLFVGNLEERKGLRLLLEAFGRLSTAHADLDLVIVGKDRGLRASLDRDIRKRRLQDRVQLRGFVPQHELIPLYQQAAAFVHPALSEGFGIPPLEAMACGAPVVAAQTPTAEENLSGAACLSPPDSASLAAAIGMVLDNHTYRQSLIHAGRDLAARFTWERTTIVVWEALQASCAAQP